MKITQISLLVTLLTMGAVQISAAQDQAGLSPDLRAPQNAALKSSSPATQTQLAKGRNSFTKGQAQDRILKAGYSDVQNLTLDADGLWQATAQLNGQSVHVALDYKGAVASR